MRDFSVGFFQDSSTTASIDELAAATDVTIFCGAGVSMDQGFPSWSRLVRALLAELMPSKVGSMSRDVVDSLTRHVIDSYYSIPTATIVDALFEEEIGADFADVRDEKIKSLMYDGLRPRSPSLAEDVLLLALAFKIAGRNVEIVTTNYDDLLEWVTANNADVEHAFESAKIAVRPYFQEPPSRRTASPAEIPIVHIHGYLPRAGEASRAILSERDYAQWSDSSQFKAYLSDAFSSTTVLFVGSSLRDSNILSRSRLAPGRGARVAVVSAQDEVNSIPEELAAHWEKIVGYASLRGDQLNVDVLRPDFFGQVPQFWNEVAFKVSLRDDYVPYMDRLKRWSDEWYRDSYNSRARREEAVRACRTVVADWLPKLASVDHAKIEIWVRGDDGKRSLELWGSSQTLWLPGVDYWPRSVQLKASTIGESAAVEAFASQASAQGRVVQDPRRWTHFFAVPIILSHDDYLRLPVGVALMMLRSPTNIGTDKIPSVDYISDDLRRALVDLGVSATSPATPPGPVPA